MSSRHSRLSKGIEAFISRITAAGPSAKRPPHMALEVSLRALIPFLLVATLMVGGCDRAKPGAEQASGALADANQASPDAVAASPDEEAPGGPSAGTTGRGDRPGEGRGGKGG